eukprot:TRINITY_DN18231_c0_g1_i1.p1 TRINITY_DN18231_c0_g1~~TRINITY_DN18231_c0_g1_i1.p1  ORF type:complete len:413 (+),score=68.44 TRINITY_DN18231_c0_g1_i1:81-1319(+)
MGEMEQGMQRMVLLAGSDGDVVAELRQENQLLTELSRVNEAENKALHKEIERLRGALARAEKRTPMSSSHTQTYEPSDHEKKLAAYVEELKLLRTQAVLDHARIQQAETEANVATHRVESLERDVAAAEEERSQWEARYTELADDLDKYKSQVRDDQDSVRRIRDQLEAAKQANSSLKQEDWRSFWERKATQDAAKTDGKNAATAATIAVLATASEKLVTSPSASASSNTAPPPAEKASLLTSLRYNSFPALQEVQVATSCAAYSAAMCLVLAQSASRTGRSSSGPVEAPMPTAFLPAFQTIRQLRQQRGGEDARAKPGGHTVVTTAASSGAAKAQPVNVSLSQSVRNAPRTGNPLHSLHDLPSDEHVVRAYKGAGQRDSFGLSSGPSPRTKASTTTAVVLSSPRGSKETPS